MATVGRKGGYIRIELRPDERERIERGAAVAGYRSLTDYVRSLALERSDRACAEAERQAGAQG